MILYTEITQGDPLYYQIAFTDPYGAPINLTGWGIEVAFRLSYAAPSSLLDLSIANEGVGFLNADATTGVIYLTSIPDPFEIIDIDPYPRNGDVVPSRTIYGDVKLTPPTGIALVQGFGARTAISLKVKAGLT